MDEKVHAPTDDIKSKAVRLGLLQKLDEPRSKRDGRLKKLTKPLLLVTREQAEHLTDAFSNGERLVQNTIFEFDPFRWGEVSHQRDDVIIFRDRPVEITDDVRTHRALHASNAVDNASVSLVLPIA